MTRVISCALTAVALSVFAPGPITAASFDCAKAGTATEKKICGDPTLSKLDEDLAHAYRQALSADPEPGVLKARQKAWLRDRRGACVEVACLKDVYERRIARLGDIAAFAAATGRSEPVLADFVLAELKLESAYLQPRLVPLRPPGGTPAKTIAFFVTAEYGLVKRGVIDISGTQPRVLGVEDYDECHCQSVSASSVRLVAPEPDFVIVEYSPRTGTCVGVERMDIFRAAENGTLQLVWAGDTYFAGSREPGVHEADIAEISFPRTRDGDDRAILRSVKQVRCGDEDCFCRDGPLIRDFVEFFLWDPATGRFRPAR